MQVSQARIAANQANSARSTGPRTAEGKGRSRQNSYKHGLTASIVVPEGDQAEVESRVADLHDEMQPRTAMGSILIRKIAAFSVRSERSVERENALIAQQVRSAVAVYDEDRARQVDTHFAAIQENPRAVVRNLRMMPEGCDRMIEAWTILRRDLDREDRNYWGSAELSKAVNLVGERFSDAHRTRIGDLSNAIWGDFDRLTDQEGGDLNGAGRRDWARVALLEIIDARIAELEAHRATLDLDRIEKDRQEAPIRVPLDDSREACLTRRYEADADRGFYKALKEFRQVEAEAAARIEAGPDVPAPEQPDPIMGSFRAATPPSDRERALAFLDDSMNEDSVIRGADGLPLSVTRPLSPPV